MTIEIQLTQGQVALVSDEDADLVQVKWFASFNKAYGNGGKFRAQRFIYSSEKPKCEYLHRVVMTRMAGRDLLRTEHVDHINGDPLDNRRENLRLATASQNAMNKGKQSRNTSGYKGVIWCKVCQKWRAQVNAKGKVEYKAYFDTAEAAAEAYCEASKRIHGAFTSVK